MITIQIKPSDNKGTESICNFTFLRGDVKESCCVFSESEMLRVSTDVYKAPGVCIYDIGRVVLCRAWDLSIVRPYDCDETRTVGPYTPEAWRYPLDVPKLMHAAMKLTTKNKVYDRKREWDNLETRVPLDRFKVPHERAPILTINQMVQHPNVDDPKRFTATVKKFQLTVKPEEFTRLRFDLSNYLPRAKFWGQGDEFYFDGRRMGLGFNGGFILHGDTYGIHT